VRPIRWHLGCYKEGILEDKVAEHAGRVFTGLAGHSSRPVQEIGKTGRGEAGMILRLINGDTKQRAINLNKLTENSSLIC
jgi:hypothetical protein